MACLSRMINYVINLGIRGRRAGCRHMPAQESQFRAPRRAPQQNGKSEDLGEHGFNSYK